MSTRDEGTNINAGDNAATTMMVNNTNNKTTNNDGMMNPLAQLNLPTPLLLGSASYTRKLILKEMNIPIHPLVRPIDEKSLGNRSKFANPSDLVMDVASAKMDHLVHEIRVGNCDNDLPATTPISTITATTISSESNDSNGDSTDGSNTAINEWIVLTGDQVVVCEHEILEKPTSIEQAKQFVSRYAKYPCSTVGSCILTHLPSGIRVRGVDTATIHFRSSIGTSIDGQDMVDQLISQGAPILSCAGGLMIEHPLVKQHIDRIDGTEDSVMGLSKNLVMRLLNELKDELVIHYKQRERR